VLAAGRGASNSNQKPRPSRSTQRPSDRESAPLALRVQELNQVGFVGGEALPRRPELFHTVPAVFAFALGFPRAHRDHGIDAPGPRGTMSDADRSDLDRLAIWSARPARVGTDYKNIVPHRSFV
jgi:hypothetical protein